VTGVRARVGDLLKLERRRVTVDPDKEYEEIGVRSFGRGIFHKQPIAGVELGNKRVFRIEPGDLIISNVFGWEGAIAVASEAEFGKIGSHRFMTFVPIGNQITTSWAAWFFRSEPGLELIRQASPGSAGRNRTLAIERFAALEIPLPPIDEQKRVAQRLDDLEALAAELRRATQKAASLSAALAVSCVMRADLNTGSKALAGWRRLRLGDLLTQNLDEVPSSDSESYQVAGVYSFGRGMFERTTIEGSRTSYKTLHRLHAGQLVMSRLKAWEGAITIVPDAFDGWFLSPEFPTFDLDVNQVDPGYFGALVTSEPFWSRLRGASRGIGARRERVHAARLLEQVIDLPPLSSQRSVASILSRLSTAAGHRSSAVERLEALVAAGLNDVFASLS